ncbi:MAG: hypothetical protein LBU77_04490 [Clostridiales bacterium]|nr:hypothetical protein [Clostridiales bacterium]
MRILENFQNVFSVAGQKAKKTYDIKLLIHKIKGYEKELKNCFTTVGRALYTSRKENLPLDETLISTTFENIDNMIYRINLLSKQLESLRRQPPGGQKGQRKESGCQDAADASANENIEEKYAKLSMKEDDLKIRRTVEGIKAVRVCPACGAANDPAEETCKSCSGILRGNH